MTDEPHETLDGNPIDTDRMLLDFVSGRDIQCPLCGYNLRDLTKTTCPECEHQLELRVGVQRLRLLPFVMSIAPGIFSGMCAVVLTIILFVNYVANGRFVGVPWRIFGVDAFGWLSGLFAVWLIATRNRFLASPLPRQRTQAWIIWIVHFMALVVVLAPLLW